MLSIKDLFVAGKRRTTTECQECKEPTGPTIPRLNLNLPCRPIFISPQSKMFQISLLQDVSVQDAEGCRPPNADGQGWENGKLEFKKQLQSVTESSLITLIFVAQQRDPENAGHEPGLSEASCGSPGSCCTFIFALKIDHFFVSAPGHHHGWRNALCGGLLWAACF